MWTIEPHEDYEKRRKKWPAKHKRELLAVHDNLDTFLKALNSGQRPAEARFGFIHVEPMGILAIDQKGGGQSLKETRLYIYPDVHTETLHLVTLGDKDGQANDIDQCKMFAKEHRHDQDPQTQSREKSHAQERSSS